MKCKILDCGHRVHRSVSTAKHVGQSWYDHSICSCCAMELFEMGVIIGDYRHSQTCLRLIREELVSLKIDYIIPNS